MTKARLLFASVSMACVLPFAAFAADATPITKEEFPVLLKDTLMKNPDILMDAIKEMQNKQEAENSKAAKEAIKKHQAAFMDEKAPSTGASLKDADVTVTMFFDYHCGYCKHMVPTVSQLINGDKKVRVVFMDYPILSEDSIKAAKAAIAVNVLDKTKYFAFYAAAMKHKGKFDDASIAVLAKEAGVDSAKLAQEMAKPSTENILDKIQSAGREVGVQGTPAVIIGDNFYPGALSFDELNRLIEKVRAEKKQ